TGAASPPSSGGRLSFAFIVAAPRGPSIFPGSGRGRRDDPAYDVDRPPHQRLRRFKRAKGGMRGESHVLHARQRVVRLERLGVKNIEPGVADVAPCERIEERSFFDQRSARGGDANQAS